MTPEYSKIIMEDETFLSCDRCNLMFANFEEEVSKSKMIEEALKHDLICRELTGHDKRSIANDERTGKNHFSHWRKESKKRIDLEDR